MLQMILNNSTSRTNEIRIVTVIPGIVLILVKVCQEDPELYKKPMNLSSKGYQFLYLKGRLWVLKFQKRNKIFDKNDTLPVSGRLGEKKGLSKIQFYYYYYYYYYYYFLLLLLPLEGVLWYYRSNKSLIVRNFKRQKHKISSFSAFVIRWNVHKENI